MYNILEQRMSELFIVYKALQIIYRTQIRQNSPKHLSKKLAIIDLFNEKKNNIDKI